MNNNKPIIIWLLTGCFLIAAMVVIGGITRLTGSGLSITQWKLVTGTIPPLNETQWMEEFDEYKQTPQFQKINSHFELEDFKNIYWWEYIHRLVGRSIGLIFLIPFLYFLLRKKLERSLIPKLLIVFFLGGLQGFIGWYMVSSGLVDNPYVAHYRLALHLVTAFITFGYTLWIALSLMKKEQLNTPALVRTFSWVILLIVVVQLIYGAFVAGTKAGFIYNTFPLMGNSFIPPEMGTLQPAWLNLFENTVTLQFIHRCIAYLLTLMVVILWIYSLKNKLQPVLQSAVQLMMLIVMFQVVLGIITILNLHLNPVFLGSLHQFGALMVFIVSVYLVSLTQFQR
ncbi:MAG: Heme A synthase [Bacteroidia bacterium]|nr:Heme A synthase [Bacteroidia bacterium]